MGDGYIDTDGTDLMYGLTHIFRFRLLNFALFFTYSLILFN